MGCGMGMIKYLLFIFNIIFAICGIAILAVGVVLHLQLAQVNGTFDDQQEVIFPSVALIVVGSIIFVISFFGCWGAIRENHCMTVTFAIFLLVILIIQVAVAAYAFIVFSSSEESKTSIENSYEKFFKTYWSKKAHQEVIDAIQGNFQCCGVKSEKDFLPIPPDQSFPKSCCAEFTKDGTTCRSNYKDGCAEKIKDFLINLGKILGGVSLAVAGVELIGIIFALCLANSIRNAQRRGYRV